MRNAIIVTVLNAVACGQCLSKTPVEPASDATLDEVVVEGMPPSPAIWRITREDSDHALWVVTEAPLMPQGITWHTQAMQTVASQAQEIVFSGGFAVVPDGKMGVIRVLSLLPAALSARKNPGGEKLSDLLSPDVYSRWLVQKEIYIGRDSGIEKWRPMFIADELRGKALERHQRKKAQSVRGVLLKVAKEKGIKVTYPMVRIKIPPQEFRSTIKQFAKTPLNDLSCFTETLEFVEALADESVIRARATAWSTGDIDTLRKITPLSRPQDACQAELLSSPAVARFDVKDVPARVRTAWIDAIDKSLEANEATLALMPLFETLSDDGYFATLRARGYSIALQ